MYTWGHIKETTLAKLDLTSDDAIAQNFVNKFVPYANEAMTQICSSIKPKYTYAEFDVVDKIKFMEYLKNKYSLGDFYFLTTSKYNYEDLSTNEKNAYDEYYSKQFTNEQIKMPKDFINFAQVRNEIQVSNFIREAFDDDFRVNGYNTITCYITGIYKIAYDARWFTFPITIDDNFELEIPDDILDCVPSYIASQCYKIDDEAKSAVYRNEYEMFLSRIENSDYRSNATMHITGGWL